MNVRSIMSEHVVSVPPSEPVRRAAQRMREHDVGALPVVAGERCVGVITDRDIALRVTAEGRDSEHLRVAEVMSVPPIVCAPELAVTDAAHRMAHRRVRRLVVEDGDRGVCGVVSLGDLAIHGVRATDDALRHVCEPS